MMAQNEWKISWRNFVYQARHKMVKREDNRSTGVFKANHFLEHADLQCPITAEDGWRTYFSNQTTVANHYQGSKVHY